MHGGKGLTPVKAGKAIQKYKPTIPENREVWRGGMRMEQGLSWIAARLAWTMLGVLVTVHGAGQGSQGQAGGAAKPMVYGSHDLFYVVEIPAGWEYRNEEGSNEITISKDDVSVSVAVVDAEIGNTVETLLEARKKLLLERCPSAELHEETTQAVAGVAGRSLTMYCAGPSAPTTVRVSASMQYWKFFVFYVTCPTAKWSEMQPIVDRMARSFRHGDGLPEGRAERMRAK